MITTHTYIHTLENESDLVGRRINGTCRPHRRGRLLQSRRRHRPSSHRHPPYRHRRIVFHTHSSYQCMYVCMYVCTSPLQIEDLPPMSRFYHTRWKLVPPIRPIHTFITYILMCRMYVCMYNVYMSFPQMRHCNIAPLHQLGMYVCMYVCMYGILVMAAHLLLRESEGHESIHRFHFVVCEVDHVRLAGCCSPAHTSAAACWPERPISYIHTYIHIRMATCSAKNRL